MASSHLYFPFFFTFFSSLFHLLHSQQPFINNKQLDCYKNFSDTLGYTCNGLQTSCKSYLTFRSNPPYDSAVTIGYLLNSNASETAQLNQLSAVDKISLDTQILVPVSCTCSGGFYQHDAFYHLDHPNDTYFKAANDTYQGLTTCQAMMNQNKIDSLKLVPGLKLLAPLRCACPTRNQSRDGVKFLLTYMITWGDTLNDIAKRFKVDEPSIVDANELSSDLIFPFNTLLIPLKSEPTPIIATIPPPLPKSPDAGFVSTDEKSSKSKTWVFVGIGLGVGILLLVLVSGCLIWVLQRRRQRRGKPIRGGDKLEEAGAEYAGLPSKQSESISAEGLLEVIDSLAVYKFEELQKATGFFDEEHRIKGSVYRGDIGSDNAAIKRMKGDVSREINTLKRINHSNVVRLSGFCLHDDNTYLVYEFAENGSLSDCLHENKNESASSLNWKRRVQIAYDVADGLNYLHNYANPPHIHKDLKSSHILLDGNFRAKVANFGLARTMESHQGFQMTAHVVGTQGYMAPEYLEHGLITPKLDVFAFGVLMLELLSGREAATSSNDGRNRDLLLSESIVQVLEGENVRGKLRGFVDPSLQSDYPFDLAFTMAQLAKNCVAQDLNARPTISEVSLSLLKILSSSLDWDSSDYSYSCSVDGR